MVIIKESKLDIIEAKLGILDFGEPAISRLESCLHEMAHVYDIMGEFYPCLRYESVNKIINTLPSSKAQDYNEIRATAATVCALQLLELSTPDIEVASIDSMGCNIECLSTTTLDREWERMSNSMRSIRVGRAIAKEVVYQGVVI